MPVSRPKDIVPKFAISKNRTNSTSLAYEIATNGKGIAMLGSGRKIRAQRASFSSEQGSVS